MSNVPPPLPSSKPPSSSSTINQVNDGLHGREDWQSLARTIEAVSQGEFGKSCDSSTSSTSSGTSSGSNTRGSPLRSAKKKKRKKGLQKMGRFDLLLLEDGEYYFQDFAAYRLEVGDFPAQILQDSSSYQKRNGANYASFLNRQSRLKRCAGRIKIGSRGIYFEPKERHEPITKFPFRNMPSPPSFVLDASATTGQSQKYFRENETNTGYAIDQHSSTSSGNSNTHCVGTGQFFLVRSHLSIQYRADGVHKPYRVVDHSSDSATATATTTSNLKFWLVHTVFLRIYTYIYIN